MNISDDFMFPKVSLHRLELPKEQRNAVRSAPDSQKEEALLALIKSIVNPHQLETLKSTIKKINDFRILFFCYRSSGTSLIGKQLKEHNPNVILNRSQVDYLIFFIRALPEQKPDLFAATRGNSMLHIIKELIDYKFPWKIAKRHFSPGLLELKTRHLIGPVLSSSEKFYGKPFFSSLQLQSQFITKFTTRVKKESSLYCQFKKHTEEQSITVDIKMNSIRFNKDLSLLDYSNILNQLTKIYRDERTFQCLHFPPHQVERAEEDDDSFSFLDLVVKAPIKEREKLENCLLERLWELYRQPENPSDLRLWHRYSDDYLRSGEFKLCYGERKIKKWTAPPSISDVLSAIGTFKKIETLDRFCEEIKNIKLSFQLNGKPYKECLVKFFEAEVGTQKGKIYFRNHGIWLEVSSEYLILVQNDFRKSINHSLISRSHRAQLHIRWMSQMGWAAINWGEMRKQIKHVAKTEQQLAEIWNKVEPLTAFLTKDGKIKKKRRLEETAEKINKRQRLIKQTSIFGLMSLSKSRTAALPSEKENFVITESPKEFPKPLQSFLKHKHQLYQDVKNEGEYNALYIEEPNFFVGDRITPNGIELFDLMKEVGPDLYLYQVKESISETTTKACSQLRNAAEALSGTLLNPKASSNILKKFWSDATSAKKDPYFKKLKKFYEKYEFENFAKLFHRDRKNICFVLAFLDVHQKEVEIEKEGKLKIILNPKDFDKMSPKISGKKIYEELLAREYIDKKGQIAMSFEAAKQRQFDLGEKINSDLTSRIFYKIYRKLTFFHSTLAKVDITLTQKVIEELGFTFRICQIYRPENTVETDHEQENIEWDFSTQTLRSELSRIQQDQCVIDGKNYSIISTPPDGSCGLHALLGKINSKECRFLEESPKTVFVKKIKDNLDGIKDILLQCQTDLLEKALSVDSSKEAKLAYPSEILQNFSSAYRSKEIARAARNKELRIHEGEEWRGLINNSPAAKKYVIEKIFPKKSYFFQQITNRDVETLINWIDGERQTVEKFFKNEQLVPIRKLHRQRIDDQEILKLKRDFISDPNVRNFYFEALQKPNYYLSTQEILLAAKLFRVSCRIYVKREDNTEIADQHLLPQENMVHIFHHFPFSQHFSRLVTNEPAST